MSFRKFAVLALVAGAVTTAPESAAAQATFTPTFQAPYRAFEQQEFGAVLSFPDGADFGIEGQFRVAVQNFDIGVRGGIVDFPGGSDFVIGVEGRVPVLDQTENDFPLDGSVVVGLGTAEGDAWIVPSAGISLGRRVELEDFEFVVYGQPTLFVTSVDTGVVDDTDFDFNLGFGIDFQVGEALELRTSFAFLDAPGDGIGFSLVWMR